MTYGHFSPEKIGESGQPLRQIINNIPGMIAYVDSDFQYRFANEAYAEWFDHTPETLLGKTIPDIMGPERWAPVSRHLQRALAGETVIYEAARESIDGGAQHIQVHIVPDNRADDGIVGVYILSTDITQRKASAEALQQSQLGLERALAVQSATLNALPAHIVLLDSDGNVTWACESWDALFAGDNSLAGEGATGAKYLDICGPIIGLTGTDADITAAGLQQVLDGEQDNFIHEHAAHLPRKKRWYRIMAATASDGTNGRAVVMHIDITAEREAADRLRQAEQSESLGALAGGIAHEINNMLTPIFILTSLTSDRLAPDSVEKQNLDKVYEAGERISELVKGMLTFSRVEEVDLISVDIQSTVSEGISLWRTILPIDVRLETDINPVGRRVMVNPTQLHQVLLNLALNAADAIGSGGGTISVNLDEVTLGGPLASAGMRDLEAGDYARIAVSDTGCGIDPDTLRHIFDPFFSTKDVGSGTGLGLSIVHGIVLSHHGGISVSSHPGKGSTFEIFLPLAERDE